ncbi:MAG: hypothetical protein ACI8WT_004019 [Clostridium sp.]|jgi:hypothetical protein
MIINSATIIYFTPTGTTKKVMLLIQLKSKFRTIIFLSQKQQLLHTEAR